jgi:hypothetical protein
VIISGGGGALVCLNSGGLAPPERVSRTCQQVLRHPKKLEIYFMFLAENRHHQELYCLIFMVWLAFLVLKFWL